MLGRAAALRHHALARFDAQLFQCGGAAGGAGQGQFGGHAAQLLHWAAARQQQVAQGQLGQLEVGVVAHQALGLGQGLAVVAVAGEPENLQQPGFGLSIPQGRGL